MAGVVAVSGCVQSTPQIVDISPSRGATNVRTNAPIAISFDRPVDRESVAARFRLLDLGSHPLLEIPPRQCPEPSGKPVSVAAAPGGAPQLLFTHATLDTNTEYQAVLLGGYRDAQGQANGLCHYWTFTTESAPVVTAISPADRARDVDPAAYISLSFSRAMDARSVSSALTVLPPVAYSVRAGGDPRTVVVAPQELLNPGSTFTVGVARGARDLDGNQLAGPGEASFTTGPFRPLHHWVTFIARKPGDVAGSGVWIVDPTGFPRQLTAGGVRAYSWSPDGTHLLVGDPSGRWSDNALGSGSSRLPFTADWAASLGDQAGYVYLSQGRLAFLDAGGDTIAIASGVGEATLDPSGRRVAFTVPGPATTAIRGYDFDLRAQYGLQSEYGLVTGLAWSPDAAHLAYRLHAPDPARDRVRVRDLGHSGATVTAATGELGDPSWQPDSLHVLFTGAVASRSGGPARAKIFVINVSAPPATLQVSQGLPAGDLEPISAAGSPDGRQIAFLADRGSGPQVWLMNADGSGLAQLTVPDRSLFPYSCEALAWTRD